MSSSEGDLDDPEGEMDDPEAPLVQDSAPTPATPFLKLYFEAGMLSTVRRRIQWLVLLLLLQSFAALILDLVLETYSDSQVIAVVAYIPMVVGTGGSAGNQAIMAVTRALGSGSSVGYDVKCRMLRREAAMACVTSSVLGVVAGIRVLCFDPMNALVASAATSITVWVVVNLAVVGGVALTLVLDRLRIDPADAAAPLLSTTIDVVGVAVLVGIAEALAV